MEQTLIYSDKDFDLKGESNNFKYNFTNIEISKIVPRTQEAINSIDEVRQPTMDVVQADLNEELTFVSFYVEIEHLAGEDIDFYPNGTLITNTKEQVNPIVLFADEVGGTFMGQVKKEGNIDYILKSKAEDLKSFELKIDAPFDQNYNSVGEAISLKFEIK